MVSTTHPTKRVQEIKMKFEDVSQAAVETRITGSALTAKVSVFIDAEQDSRAYAALLTDLYDEGYDVEDKGVKESGRRLVKGEQEL